MRGLVAIRLGPVVAGLVLLAAAVFQLQAIVTEAEEWWEAALRTLAALIEGLLGAWLLLWPPGRLVVASGGVLFAGFAGYHGYALVMDWPPCRCLAGIAPAHGVMLAMTGVCAVLRGMTLGLGVSQRWDATMRGKAWRVGLGTVLASGLIGLLLAVADHWPWLARVRGEAVRISQRSPTPDPVPVGQRREVVLMVTNKWDRAVTLVGGTFACACNTTRDLPLTLAPGDRKALRVSLAAFARPGHYPIPIQLYTDVRWQWRVTGKLHVVAKAPPSQPPAKRGIEESDHVLSLNRVR